MTQTYNENSIRTLNYRESARESLGMYIGSNDINGMHHLLTEIVANSMDEAAAGYGKKITVYIDRDENRATVIDEGRGIPFKKNADGKWAIIEMCTNMHSGGKFSGQGNYKSSLGLNGVGATVTNALSSEFDIEVRRDGCICTFSVVDGEYDDEPIIKPYKGKDTGTSLSFIPDTEIFGDLEWDINKIKEELQLHALLNNGITFEVIERSNGKVISTARYIYNNGIKDMLKLKTEGLNMLTDPVYFKTNIELNGETCDVEFAFAYCDKTYETIYSFVNGGYTPHDGTHVTGFKTAFTSLMNKMAREQDVLRDKDKNFSGDIVRKGLVLVLSIKMSERPLFAEQTKLTLNSPSARTFCSKAVGQLTLDKKASKQIFDKIMIEQKAEEAAQRKREAQEKIARGGKSMNSLRDLPEKLADASDFSDAELFLVEGDSAAGGAREMKASNQAVLALRGKVLNTTTKELADAIKSDIIKDILTCLGCGIGDHFNINNLRYNRIILMCDADPDGGHIELLLMSLFLHHLPELVLQGKIYAAMPPLYKTTNGKEIKYWYSYNESEYKKYMRNHKNARAIRYKGLGEQNAEELYETTMNPENRHLIQLTTDNLEQTIALYDQLMGKSPAMRRDFIMKNKLSRLSDEDIFDDNEDFDE
jgi:DNA gyrase/topoisomerase IV subunit B